jgi:hypothetical protein
VSGLSTCPIGRTVKSIAEVSAMEGTQSRLSMTNR